MARWDDLPDDVQEVISASVRRNLEACLAEKAIRLESLVKETRRACLHRAAYMVNSCVCFSSSPTRLAVLKKKISFEGEASQ